MYAVVNVNGFQYKVSVGDSLAVQKLEGEPGSKIDIPDVLMLGQGKDSVIGTPIVPNASVSATIVKQAKDDKIIVFKKKRRKGYKLKKGHRQQLTWLMIDDISFKGKGAISAKSKAEPVSEEE